MLLLSRGMMAQPTQSIRGTVADMASNAPVANARIEVFGAGEAIGSLSDSLGNFIVNDVPVGRYDIQVSAKGYESSLVREIVVTSSKQTYVNIFLTEKVTAFEGTKVKPKVSKSQAPNSTASVSARTLSVEEAKRYAGGFDDPARLASSFAGVSSNTGENGIMIRGNAPKFAQWKMEGVEIPNPNHFGNLLSFGGGTFTALSSQMLANSGFYTGAFPAEYNNALSGVFDINMRVGNNQKRESTFQLGLIGIDFASEGPFKKGGKSSYLFNYRYSTLALLKPLLPDGADGLKYQDLSFKMNFPTDKFGTFSIWGIGLLDKARSKAKIDSTQWKYYDDKSDDKINLYMGAFGLNHKFNLRKGVYVKSSLATTLNGTDWSTEKFNRDMQLMPTDNISCKNSNIVLSSFLNAKFNSRHTNKTGFVITGMFYDYSLNSSLNLDLPPSEIVRSNGFGALISAYSNSTLKLNDRLVMNIGLNNQFFTLNRHYSPEPRIGLSYQVRKEQKIAFAYGLHSRLEQLNYYLNNSLKTGEKEVNKHLDFSKAHHFVLSYDKNFNDLVHLKIEPYFQYLFSIPVIPDSSFSMINLKNDWFFAEKLENSGKGRNYGLDITLERYMSKGFYYLFSGSVFSSEYKGGDGVWRSTRFNRNFTLNMLFGKEWKTGVKDQNVFSLNTRFSYQGGNHYSQVNESASRMSRQVVFNETNAYSLQVKPSLNVHFTASYKVNRKNHSSEIALKLLNVTGQPDFNGFKYNLMENKVEKDLSSVIMPNLTYKIEF